MLPRRGRLRRRAERGGRVSVRREPRREHCEPHRRELPELPADRVGGDEEHAASLGADRRQGAHGLDRSAEPLVARSALRRRARPDDASHARDETVSRFEIDFDFVDHRLVVTTNHGAVESFELVDGLSVAEFDEKLHATLAGLGIDVAIRETPFGCRRRPRSQTIGSTPPTTETRSSASGTSSTGRDEVFEEFAGWYCGKTSPVHLFWHSLDLALTRFGGSAHRRCPTRTPSTERPTRTRSSRSASGPATRTCASRATTRTPPGARRPSQQPLQPERGSLDRAAERLARAPALRGGADGRGPESSAARVPGERVPGRCRRVRLGSGGLDSSWCPSPPELSDLLAGRTDTTGRGHGFPS